LTLLNDRFSAYLRILEKESDRGAIIVGAAILDDIVREILIARLVPTTEKEDELLDRSGAPCGSYGARVDLAYRVGAIGALARRGLHLIRRMRNEVAHVGDHQDFSSRALVDRVQELFRCEHGLVGMICAILQSPTPEWWKAPKSADPAKDFVDEVGWRRAWDILVALRAAGLSEVIGLQERLVARNLVSKVTGEGPNHDETE